MKRQAPCKDCPDRTAECHADCQKYAAWAEEGRLLREAKNRASRIENDITAAKEAKFRKLQRGKGRKKR